MKRIILVICLAFGCSQISSAQLDFGVKGGINYNSNSIEETGQDVFGGATSKTGFHAGIWLRAKIPLLGLYIRPELVYTNLENEIVYNRPGEVVGEVTTHTFQKIDIPVLLGKKIFGIGNVFIGPSFQYILASDFQIDDISSVDSNGFTMGLQFGGGIEFGKLGIDVRWERAFSGVESSFGGSLGDVNYDTRINQIIIGLSISL
ncbi:MULTISPECIES: porin family protein [unclassified Polaribacter]|uniref:porin family protein n=1 Tax=unclassified Polaribacter TaxID=196858 RepID=UPI0011BF9C6E|nr:MULTISPECIES: porin family protein [unclassified Polaribacter]TXD51744.1 PorT family protein [Polaribacter sp. IC063]TXD58955.1 PorT family protein [Polaribacter sp. IC066]